MIFIGPLSLLIGISTMREFVFDIHYEGEPGPLQKLFDSEQLPSSTAVGGCISDGEFWRIERFTDSEAALEDIDTSMLEQLLAIESITPDPCDGTIHIEVLERGATGYEVYYHIENVTDCESVSSLAVEYLGEDVLFELERGAGHETWTVVMESDDGIGLLYDGLQAILRPTIRFEFGHIGQASDRRMNLFAKKDLPPEQRDALVSAVERGYYETPRQVTLDELSDELDWPRSTLSYRLRRAESKLAKAFAFTSDSDELRSFPQTPEQSIDS